MHRHTIFTTSTFSPSYSHSPTTFLTDWMEYDQSWSLHSIEFTLLCTNPSIHPHTIPKKEKKRKEEAKKSQKIKTGNSYFFLWDLVLRLVGRLGNGDRDGDEWMDMLERNGGFFWYCLRKGTFSRGFIDGTDPGGICVHIHTYELGLEKFEGLWRDLLQQGAISMFILWKDEGLVSFSFLLFLFHYERSGLFEGRCLRPRIGRYSYKWRAENKSSRWSGFLQLGLEGELNWAEYLSWLFSYEAFNVLRLDLFSRYSVFFLFFS